jgi:hypothetical protein
MAGHQLTAYLGCSINERTSTGGRWISAGPEYFRTMPLRNPRLTGANWDKVNPLSIQIKPQIRSLAIVATEPAEVSRHVKIDGAGTSEVLAEMG